MTQQDYDGGDIMVIRGLQGMRHFQKSGDLEPLMKILKAGALSPTVQLMIANDQGTKRKGTFYLAAKRHRGDTAGPVACLRPGSRSASGSNRAMS